MMLTGGLHVRLLGMKGPKSGLGSCQGHTVHCVCLSPCTCIVAVICCFTDYAGAKAVGPPQAAAGMRRLAAYVQHCAFCPGAAVELHMHLQGVSALLISISAVHVCPSSLPVARAQCSPSFSKSGVMHSQPAFCLWVVTSTPFCSVGSFVMQDTALSIAAMQRDAGLECDDEVYLDSFKPTLMDVFYDWSQGKSFAEVRLRS